MKVNEVLWMNLYLYFYYKNVEEIYIYIVFKNIDYFKIIS